MDTYYNYKEYNRYITDKYTFSEQQYKKQFQNDEHYEMFLSFYEGMNVYPVYPRAVIMPLKKVTDITNSDLNLKLGSKLQFENSDMIKISKILEAKLKEPELITKTVVERAGVSKIRRFFDYEIRDKVTESLLKQNYKHKITNAWVKMYELLHTYNLFKEFKSDVKTFHLCEHPGAFVFATKYYVEQFLKLKHNFYYQSLKPTDVNNKIFKPDPQLLKDYPDSLDYGPFNGDITNKQNIQYYRSVYSQTKINTKTNTKIDLITSDCGLDFSSDFNKQELGLYKVYLGALTSAISLASENTHYIFKMFSFNTKKMLELLQIACLFWERVDLVRLLTTKSMSGEVYCVCLNFNYKHDVNEALSVLFKYMEEDVHSENFVLNKLDPTFVEQCVNHHKLLTVRRITSQNMFMFRFINYEYINNGNQEVKDLVKSYADYYADYFIKLFKLK